VGQGQGQGQGGRVDERSSLEARRRAVTAEDDENLSSGAPLCCTQL
jgi:hypothetical protein